MAIRSDSGKRMNFWVGSKQCWVVEMLELRVRTSEVVGIPSSIGAEIRSVLVNELRADYVREYGVDPINPEKPIETSSSQGDSESKSESYLTSDTSSGENAHRGDEGDQA